jgi:hypothetical protein
VQSKEPQNETQTAIVSFDSHKLERIGRPDPGVPGREAAKPDHSALYQRILARHGQHYGA